MARLSITMPATVLARVRTLVARTGAADMSDLIRKSLHLMDVAADADARGLELWTVDADGVPQEQIVIITEPSS